MCLLSHVQLFATAWTVAPKAPLPMGLSQREYWSGLPFPSPGDLPNSSTEPVSPVSPEMAGRFFITEPPWKPFIKGIPRSKKKKKKIPRKKIFFQLLSALNLMPCIGRLSLAAASGGYTSLRGTGFSLQWFSWLWSTGPRVHRLQ